MSAHRDGIPAAPGIVIAPARLLRWEVPRVPHNVTLPPDRVEAEVARFLAALQWAQGRIREIQAHTEAAMGAVEARIFEPQLLMLEDADLVQGTVAYIRENHLPAERAFEMQLLEWESILSHSGHPMVMDRLNDLADVRTRMVRHLLGEEDVEPTRAHGGAAAGARIILVARELTPSMTVQLDPRQVVGIVTDLGTRTSHSAILARSLDIPCVVALGDLSETVRDGQELILDGRTGRVILDPTEREKEAYRVRDYQIREWEQELVLMADLPARTRDGAELKLRANIDLPSEAAGAQLHGADGVGLYRTEFLVVGRNTPPNEEEQYRAYRQVAESFPGRPVVIRTFDLGGDKFPAFLHMQPEENPFLGWRAIRLCLDERAFFRTQLRALLRASVHGDVRVMVPMVNDVAEIRATRALFDEYRAELRAEGHDVPDRTVLGAMIETPAAALLADELARHVDFFSIGTNDLVQYTLAVDRGNARLARLYQPFHPSVLRLLELVCAAGRRAGIEVSVCGELASNPLGAFLFIGMGVGSLSVGPSALAEIKKVIRSVSAADAVEALDAVRAMPSADDVAQAVAARLGTVLDLGKFSGPWGLESHG